MDRRQSHVISLQNDHILKIPGFPVHQMARMIIAKNGLIEYFRPPLISRFNLNIKISETEGRNIKDFIYYPKIAQVYLRQIRSVIKNQTEMVNTTWYKLNDQLIYILSFIQPFKDNLVSAFNLPLINNKNVGPPEKRWPLVCELEKRRPGKN